MGHFDLEALAAPKQVSCYLFSPGPLARRIVAFDPSENMNFLCVCVCTCEIEREIESEEKREIIIVQCLVVRDYHFCFFFV